ncbi:NAD(P)H-dependent glycerol-3-phosphate dehydrogenase [Acidicapsa dinghuensis]|uniref:Glycerol-3-phosphate dehydrogenase [NAD(P)+] n=1 Tax=Acidicapsa dinghuensis TaxID=2218256 RepID=A0ABW1EC82_9BACT|nr:NAD(P)H-dependent glycerol-3-phosphate dehydrogenase [Acidicapsa dinghuensis]
MSSITVIGAGSWGTAIALSLAANPEHEVMLWPHRAEAAAVLLRDRENHQYLPGFALPEALKIVTDEREAVSSAEILVFVTPSEFLRSTVSRLAPYLDSGQILLSATKGIEDHSHLRMTQVIASAIGDAEVPPSIGALSGPSFAQEVAAGMPTALTVAFSEPAVATAIQKAVSNPSLRLYTSDDLIGVEMGGALKNVIAIAAGVLAGLGLGLNSAAGLITRGIAEMTRLAVACGGRRETLAGLSGIGDLVLTCTGSLSRNRTVGFELGRGRKLPEILAGLDGKVAEGVRTTRAALGLARSLGVEMPITEQMELILDEDKDPKAAIRDLMLRPGRHEED